MMATAKPAAAKDAAPPKKAADPLWPARVLASPDFPRVARDDPYLSPYVGAIRARFSKFKDWVDIAAVNHGSLAEFAHAHAFFGLHSLPNGDQVYREYAPNAHTAHLIGDFNGWDRKAHPMVKKEYGVWELVLPKGSPQVLHGQKYKIQFSAPTPQGLETFDRISPWARHVVQHESTLYEAVHWNPPASATYTPKHPRPAKPASLRIYEAHVGIASPDPRIATYKEFTRDVLPRIHRLGYNAVQLMAVMEHAYYASFGYQVTSFFAPSSRFGSPEDLKELVDTAHSLGIVVLLDLVHSHASKNVLDGLNHFDGSDHCYFHGGTLGWHSLWDSRLFNYGHYETLRFLLSNCRYWLDTYGFDGFRFDGVTSMLYKHHGIAYGFSGHYDEYFSNGLVDDDAVAYLMLANTLTHELVPQAITIAEDVSGMPGLCRPVTDGGVGFDYRLAMAVPDLWIKLLKEVRDDDWDMAHIAHTLTNRRWNEPTVAYAESHDQALVGDKTLAFWLMDKDMYDHMSEVYSQNPPSTIPRGLAMHCMLRLVTMALAGEAYLTFMGNEFGHPEWLDFPRAGNNSSFHYARRQWPLADDPTLRYRYLQNFDMAMMQLDDKFCLLAPGATGRMYVSLKHNGDKVLAFERWSEGDTEVDGKRVHRKLLFVFNFHPTQSFTDYRIGVQWPGRYVTVLDSDAKEFGGFARNDNSVVHHTNQLPWNDRLASLQLYLPSRSAIVLAPLVDE